MLRLAPYPVKYAKEWIAQVHRRLPALTGGMWCIGLWDGEEMRGLAVVGRPSRMLDVPARTPVQVLQVLRVAVKEGTPNACSMLYGACSRAARAMGATSLVTYIHGDEHGSSLKASGWIKDRATEGGEWSRPSRQRELAIDPKPKFRWWAPWSESVLCEECGRTYDGPACGLKHETIQMVRNGKEP